MKSLNNFKNVSKFYTEIVLCWNLFNGGGQSHRSLS